MAGIGCVVAFHVGVPFADAAWIAVELFFVMGGMNMAPALQRNSKLLPYLRARAGRIAPEFYVVWGIVLLLALFHEHAAGMIGFLLSAPFFLQNISLPFFDYQFPRDWIFVPLWFVGALLQLQFILFLMKRWILSASSWVVAMVLFGCGISFRFLFTLLTAEESASSLPSGPNMLYCLPFTHIESIGLGVLIGRGSLTRLGRWLPVLFLITIGMGLLNIFLANDALNVRSLGYEWPLRTNYAQVWGYALLALTMAALCSSESIFHRMVARANLPPRLDHFLNRLSTLTFGAYVFHGVVIAAAINGRVWLARPHQPGLRVLLFGITVMEAFFLAWLYQKSRREFRDFFQAVSEKRRKSQPDSADEALG